MHGIGNVTIAAVPKPETYCYVGSGRLSDVRRCKAHPLPCQSLIRTRRPAKHERCPTTKWRIISMHYPRIGILAVTLCIAAASAWASEYADESKDWGVSEMSRPKGPPYSSPTPLKVPGAKTVTTDDLKAMLAKEPKPVVIDALGSATMIESAQGLGSGIGEQRMFGRDVAMFPKALGALTEGDKGKPIVFYCRSSSCWHSYNASLRAVEAGYTNVLWYRGGIDAWQQSGGATVPYAVSGAAK